MNYPLSLFRTITSEQLIKLEKIGIQNTDALLSRSALPSDRDALAQQAGLEVEIITRLASLSDLVRVKGIGPRLAETLVEANLAGNVQQFLKVMRVPEVNSNQLAYQSISQSPIVRAAASALIKEISTRVQTTQSSFSLPSKRQLVHAAEEALELKPRLVLRFSDHNAEFRQKVLKVRDDEKRFVKKINLGWLSISAGFIIISFSALVFLLYQKFQMWFGGAFDITYNQLAHKMSIYIGLDFLIICTILIGFMSLVYGYWRLHLYLGETKIKLWLFNAKPYQETYEAIQEDIEKEKKSSLSVLIVTLIFTIWLIIDFFSTLMRFDNFSFQRLIKQVFFFGILIGVIAGIPTLLRLLNFRREAIHATGIQRYIIYRMFLMSALPIIVILATQVAVPAAVSTHDSIFERFIFPCIQKDVTRARQQLEAYQADESETGLREIYLEQIDQWNEDNVKELLMWRSPASIHLLNITLAAARNAILGLVFVGILVGFIFPYLIFGGLGKGVFFILLLSISFFLDNFLQARSPTWFSSEANPTASAAIIATCLLASALFFDWLYDFVTSQPKFCPSCSQELGRDDLFCKSCGLVQPYTAPKEGTIFQLTSEGLFARNRALSILTKSRDKYER